jgi:hypothetical protein
MKTDNMDQQLKNLFDGFEPDVPRGNFQAMESQLEALDVQRDLMRQTRTAKRFAVAASIVAIGALSWTAVKWLEPHEDVQPGGSGATAYTETIAEVPAAGVENLGSDLEDSRSEEKARTTTSVRIIDPVFEVETPLASSEVEGAVESSPRGSDHIKAPISGGVARSENSASIGQPEESSLASSERPDPAVRMERALELKSSVQEACEGTEVMFSLGKNDLDGSVLWNFGDGHFSSDAAPTHVFESPGTYDITISLRSRDNGMIRTRTVENMIVVRPKPEADLNWDAMLSNSGKTLTVKLLDETEGVSSSTWIVDGKGLDRGEMTCDRSGDHDVHLVVSNAYGCQDSEERNIEVGDRHRAKAPGIFSPDGDGRYDFFLPGIVEDRTEGWTLKVVDRKGQEVFKTDNPLEPWTGQLPDGTMASSGSRFNWILSIKQRGRLPQFFFDEIKVER